MYHAQYRCQCVQNDAFKQFVADLDPKYVLPSRQYITYTHLPKLKERVEKAINNLLPTTRFVAITMDTWSDRRCHAYMALTCHTFVNCKQVSFLLSFTAFKGQHTGQNIANEFERVIEKFELGQKVVYVVTDNAANMCKAFTVLAEMNTDRKTEGASAAAATPITSASTGTRTGTNRVTAIPPAVTNPTITSTSAEATTVGEDEEFGALDDETMWSDLHDIDDNESIEESLNKICTTRLSCFAHTEQLTVKEGIAKIAASPVLAKCSALSTSLHHSNLMKESFEAQFGSNRTIPKVNSTRWNSLFHQLKCVSDLDQAALAEFLRATDHSHLIFTPKDTATLSEIILVLEPFAEATDWTQGDTGTVGYVTT